MPELNLNHPCCQPREETNLITGEITKSDRPHGWIAKVTWKGSENEIRFIIDDAYGETEIGSPDGPFHLVNYTKTFSGTKTIIKGCFCNEELYSQLFGVIFFFEAETIIGQSVDKKGPSPESWQNTVSATTIAGVSYERNPSQEIIRTPHGSLTPLLIIPISQEGDNFALENQQVSVYLGHPQAFAHYLAQYENRTATNQKSTGFIGAYDTEGKPTDCPSLGLSYAYDTPEDSQTIHGVYSCKYPYIDNRIYDFGIRDGNIRISQRDADLYWCGGVYRGEQQFINLCNTKLIPDRLTKCHNLEESSPSIDWQKKEGLKIGEKGTTDFDRFLPLPREYKSAFIESIEFIYCNCCDCCAIGETILNLFEEVLM